MGIVNCADSIQVTLRTYIGNILVSRLRATVKRGYFMYTGFSKNENNVYNLPNL